MDIDIEKLMRKFEYQDKRIEHLLGMFDDQVRFIRDYDNQFKLNDKDHVRQILNGYRNLASGILLSMLQLGHITPSDFHHRMHALNTVYFAREGF